MVTACIFYFVQGTAYANSWLHSDTPYNRYLANKLIITGDGVSATKELTVGQIEAMAGGSFTGTYTMRTLVEPHNDKYQGICLDYLLKQLVRINEGAKTVSITCADGLSMDFELEELIKRNYINEVDQSNLPVILAYGKEGYPLVPNISSDGYNHKLGNDGGPLRLMLGQTVKGEHNSPRCLQNVTKIVVSTSEKAAGFTDVGRFYSWAREAINDLASRGIIGGVSPGKFGPDQNLTRAQFAKILTLALGLTPQEVTKTRFSDVASGAWYAPSVELAAERGLIGGYADGTFKPDQPVSRQEMVVMVVRAMGLQEEAAAKERVDLPYQDQDKIPDWARGSAAIAAEKGLLDNIAVGYFTGAKLTNRAEAAVVVYRMLRDMEGEKSK